MDLYVQGECSDTKPLASSASASDLLTSSLFHRANFSNLTMNTKFNTRPTTTSAVRCLNGLGSAARRTLTALLGTLCCCLKSQSDEEEDEDRGKRSDLPAHRLQEEQDVEVEEESEQQQLARLDLDQELAILERLAACGISSDESEAYMSKLRVGQICIVYVHSNCHTHCHF